VDEHSIETPAANDGFRHLDPRHMVHDRITGGIVVALVGPATVTAAFLVAALVEMPWHGGIYPGAMVALNIGLPCPVALAERSTATLHRVDAADRIRSGTLWRTINVPGPACSTDVTGHRAPPPAFDSARVHRRNRALKVALHGLARRRQSRYETTFWRAAA
jgi:hypothetical protein